MRRAWGVVLVLIVGAGLAGCGDDSETSDATGWPKPTGSSTTVEPTSEIRDAKLFESDGVSVLVPDGWETRRTEQPEFVQIRVVRSDDERNPVLVTVQTPLVIADQTQPGTADTVETTATVAFSELAIAGATDLEQHPATWSGWQYASSITGVFDQGEDGVVTDFFYVVALSDSGLVVAVSAQAPQGQLDDALSYQVLRSVRPVG
ncbi:MAG: hypothetical protein FWH11_07970 [Micrococcales bacterium]|nr:hypothetical protein [Micrococcales bacterium]